MRAVLQPRVYWAPRTSLAAVENTHNRAGGRVWPHRQACAVAEQAHASGLAAHLDGARLWNGRAGSGVEVVGWWAPCDTVSVCFSKGRGAPVGSAFCGPRALVEEARRIRNRWGGGMRQAGILAAGAMHALTHHRSRLTEDHANARVLAERAAQLDGARVDVAGVETNIVNIDVDDVAADDVARAARDLGLLIGASAPHRLRAVTHLDVSRADIDAATAILGAALKRARSRDDGRGEDPQISLFFPSFAPFLPSLRGV